MSSGFGNTPTTTTQGTLATNQFPIAEVYTPNTTNGNLTALQGGTSSTDTLGNTSAPVMAQLAAGSAVVGHVIVDSAGAVSVVALPALPAGSNAIGTVGVTTLPALPSGTNVIGHVIVDSAGSVSITSLPSLPAGSNLIGGTQLVDSAGTNKASVSASGAVSENLTQVNGVTLSGSNPVPVSGAVNTALTPYASNPAQTAASAADTLYKWGASGTTSGTRLALQNNSTVNVLYAFDSDSTASASQVYTLVPGDYIFWERSFTVFHCHTSSQVSFGGLTGITIEAFA